MVLCSKFALELFRYIFIGFKMVALLVKALISPLGGLFTFGHSKVGLAERGVYSQNGMTSIYTYDSFMSSFTPYYVDATFNFGSRMHTFDTILS